MGRSPRMGLLPKRQLQRLLPTLVAFSVVTSLLLCCQHGTDFRVGRNDQLLFLRPTPRVDPRAVELLALGASPRNGELYPDDIFEVDWSEHVRRLDILHLGELQEACTAHNDTIVSWRYREGSNAQSIVHPSMVKDDPERLVQLLQDCAWIDVFTPKGIRTQGYCEDSAAFVKYLHGRMLPPWVLELQFFDKTTNRTFGYHDLCPRTPILFLNHYWDNATLDLPASKAFYLMPNIEMYELNATHYWRADIIFCKTWLCFDYLTRWFAQEGNPKMTRLIYTRFTSTDIATKATTSSGSESRDARWTDRASTKNYAQPVFTHIAGSSIQKGTSCILDCWLSRPDLPRLDLYAAQDLYEEWFQERYGDAIMTSGNVKLHLGKMDGVTFGRVLADSSFFLCTSIMEGYGHYINQARASGGVIVVPDVPPMNELIVNASGLAMRATRTAREEQFLGGTSRHELALRGVQGFVAEFGGDDVCAAVDAILTQLSLRERQRRAQRARQQCFYDTAFFAMKMQEMRDLMWPHGVHSVPAIL